MVLGYAELVSILGTPIATDVAKNSAIAFTGVTIDSRQVQPGDLFVAVRGETFDGHDFIPAAIAKGAVAVVSCMPSSLPAGVPQWIVSDTIDALASLAKYHRDRYTCPVIALTGSNGKTTVKEMIAAILPQPSHATPGNLNNHIGVPLSVFKLDESHRYAVFELGANHPGEIAHTVAIVKPQVTLINNIAPAHIEGFGSIDGVARAKGEIYQGLMPGGTAVVNDDDVYAHFWDTTLQPLDQSLAEQKTVLRFSRQKPADVYVRELTYNEEGCARFFLVTPVGGARVALNVPGAHNVSNALAASTCAVALGQSVADIASALSAFSGVAGRMTYRYGQHQVLIIDDTYNANLRSTLSALDVLAKRSGPRILVFGDMGELGELSQQHHREVGLAARAHGIERVLTCGVQSELTAAAFGSDGIHYASQMDLVAALIPQLTANTTVLVKGSRSSAMERVVSQLFVHEGQWSAASADCTQGG